MSKTVGKSKTTKNSKSTKAASQKTIKAAPKITSKASASGKKSIVKTITSDNTSKLLLICVIAIAVILIIALLASSIKNKKTQIAANLELYSAGSTCDMIVREDEGKRPASGSTIVVKDSKKFREMLSDYSYLKKFNLPEPKDFSEASYVYIYSIDSISNEGLRLGNVDVQNHNVNIEVKYDERKAVDCVNAHVFVVRVGDRDIDNANFSAVAD
jgi:hypothetical protein